MAQNHCFIYLFILTCTSFKVMFSVFSLSLCYWNDQHTSLAIWLGSVQFILAILGCCKQGPPSKCWALPSVAFFGISCRTDQILLEACTIMRNRHFPKHLSDLIWDLSICKFNTFWKQPYALQIFHCFCQQEVSHGPICYWFYCFYLCY